MYWKEMIFDKALSSASHSNVDTLFLSLVATGILDINYTNDALAWVVV
jgi:hypothetical protein